MIMLTVTSTEARVRLTELLDLFEAGEEIIITRYGKPVAQFAVLGDQTKKELSI
jgi:antitoxin (DNA-binding transcriptional repressor) of toxin-antitoxin stability system